MELKLFKIGDRVELKNRIDSPQMEVLKYLNDHLVECVYFDNGQRIVETYHQRVLMKSSNTHGIFKIN